MESRKRIPAPTYDIRAIVRHVFMKAYGQIEHKASHGPEGCHDASCRMMDNGGGRGVIKLKCTHTALTSVIPRSAI